MIKDFIENLNNAEELEAYSKGVIEKRKDEEKLIKLLNQYLKQSNKHGHCTKILDDDFFIVDAKKNLGLGAETILCKKYGFIQRLCENDKIDYNKCNYAEIVYKDGKEAELESYEHILMELAIQELPVVYLCKILKG